MLLQRLALGIDESQRAAIRSAAKSTNGRFACARQTATGRDLKFVAIGQDLSLADMTPKQTRTVELIRGDA
jgi:hypothetical protein